MKIILLQDVKKVGQRGSVVTVADGYAQNVLLPKKLAVAATPENLKRWEREVEGAQKRKALDEASAQNILSAIEGKTVIIHARANETGGLFEAVHKNQIVDAIRKELHISVPEEALSISEPIKKVGEWKVSISLHGILGTVMVAVKA
ncbi:MAG TPA: 50S ribosomal protein L9 [Candidatus Paceibacterota bacterium]